MTGAGNFIVACIRKTREQLASANVAAAARQYGIPEEWARFYRDEELGKR